MNVARILENSKRTSLFGREIYCHEGFYTEDGWSCPRPGFSVDPRAIYGICIGHQFKACEVVRPELYIGGDLLEFSSVRHRWTPAWQETYYRSAPIESYYKKSGCISFCETKCINLDDVFCARITLSNDMREDVEISVRLVTEMNGEMEYKTYGGGALGDLFVRGFGAVKNTICGENEFTLKVRANSSVTFGYSFAFSKKHRDEAENKAEAVLEKENPFLENEEAFGEYMESFAPRLICEDPDVLKAYYYRWLVVRRALHSPGRVIDGHPVEGYCFYESPYGTSFGAPVGLPVPLHIEEAKWMKNPEYIRDDIKNWLNRVGCYRSFIQYTPMAVWHLYENHPDKSLLERGYEDFLEYSLSKFKQESEGIDFFPVITSSWPTGAEYQPNFYEHMEEPWDWRRDGEGIRKGLTDKPWPRMYRLDDISYAIANLMGCRNMSRELGRTSDEKLLDGLIARAKDTLIRYFWNEERGCFFSVDATTDRQCTEALCYESVFPFLFGIVGREYYSGFSPLFDENQLKCDFGVTTVSKKCPMYWFDNCIAGPAYSSVEEPHPYPCCWNGPVWPYAVSGVCEALGGAAREDEELQREWLELFEKYTNLHFVGGDRTTPMVVEHYRPTDGAPFSRVSDYFHSVWIDLFMKYWAGIYVENGKIKFEPFTDKEFTLEGVMIGGRSYTFSQSYVGGEKFRVFTED